MVKVQFLGHSFFRIDIPGCNLLIDPYLSGSPEASIVADCPLNAFLRKIPCSAKLDELKDIQAILVTHEHFDHFDKAAIEHIATKQNAIVIATYDLLNQLNIPSNLKRPIDSNKTLQYKSTHITAIPVHHPNSFNPLGFKIQYKDTCIFHSGDTDLLQAFNGGKPNIVLLPIGGKVTMDCVDAVRVVKMLKPEIAVPMHYDTFDFIKANPNEFKEKIEKSIIKTQPKILKPGQSFKY